jgi:hypothetical protein
MRRYAIYLLLFLLSLAVFGCAVLPQPPGIAPGTARFLRPEPVRLSRDADGTVRVRNGEVRSVSGLIPEFPYCRMEVDGPSTLTLTASRSGLSALQFLLPR